MNSVHIMKNETETEMEGWIVIASIAGIVAIVYIFVQAAIENAQKTYSSENFKPCPGCSRNVPNPANFCGNCHYRF